MEVALSEKDISEKERLASYADLVGTKVLIRQSDLNPQDRAMPEMLSWCRRRHEPIVVLTSGLILANYPASHVVQNCKIVLLNKGFVPGRVCPAARPLVQFLLDNAQESGVTQEHESGVSMQQRRLRWLIRDALELGASDIHIEVRADMARIRFRRHGELTLHAEWLSRLAREVVSVAFNKETDHAGTHFNPMVPQNAAMPLTLDGETIRLRLSSIPAHGGFDVVLRLLSALKTPEWGLEELGYSADQVILLKKAIAMPHGAVIVSGPTGSGKTTTLASCIRCVDSTLKVYTIEDPIEQQMSNATQVPVTLEHQDRSFAALAKASLRMDPDVIVLGEMRDEATARVMLRAAMTGHLIFSTLHTKSAPAIVMRLNDLGLSLEQLSGPDILLCLVCQRLVPLLCPACSVPLSDTAGFRRRGADPDCAACHGLGIRARTVVAEMIWVDDAGRRFIRKADWVGWQQHLYQNGWQDYPSRLVELVQTGQCDPKDAEAMVGFFPEKTP